MVPIQDALFKTDTDSSRAGGGPSAMEALDQATAVFEELSSLDQSDPMRLHDVLAAMHGIYCAVSRAERERHSPRTIRDRVASARAIHGRAPFVDRLQRWPRGYPGDFEMIECIMVTDLNFRSDTYD